MGKQSPAKRNPPRSFAHEVRERRNGKVCVWKGGHVGLFFPTLPGTLAMSRCWERLPPCSRARSQLARFTVRGVVSGSGACARALSAEGSTYLRAKVGSIPPRQSRKNAEP
jgi:hypothetical protein